jgi:hypothetical protein
MTVAAMLRSVKQLHHGLGIELWLIMTSMANE